MIAAAEVTRIARSYVGVPYRHQGHARTGVDCWGFLWAVGDEAHLIPLGLEVPTNYGRMGNEQMKERVALYCELTTTPADGVIALFKWPGMLVPGHMAILTSNGNMIHAYSIENKVVEHGFRAPWPRLCDSMWKLPGVEFP